MATARSQAAKLGIFVVAIAAILVLALFTIGGLSFWKPVAVYHIVTSEAVSGVDVKSAVTLRGVEIGKVAAIRLDHTNFDRVVIDLEVDPAIEIPAGARAYFELLGVTGERVIDISGGTRAEGRVAPGSIIPRGETELEQLQDRVEMLGDDLSELIADLTGTVQHIEALVAAVDPNRVTEIVEAVDPERVESVVVQAERALEAVAAASRSLQRTMTDGREGIETITQNVDDVAASAATVLEQADAAAAALTDVIADADGILAANEHDLRATVRNLRQTSQQAKALVEKLREQPSLLLRSPSREARSKNKQERRKAREQRKRQKRLERRGSQ